MPQSDPKLLRVTRVAIDAGVASSNLLGPTTRSLIDVLSYDTSSYTKKKLHRWNIENNLQRFDWKSISIALLFQIPWNS